MADTNDTPSVPETEDQTGAEPKTAVSIPTVEEIFGQCEQHLKIGDRQEQAREAALKTRDTEFHHLVVKAVVMVDALGGLNAALKVGVIADRLSILEIEMTDKKVKRKWRYVFDA